MKIRVAVLFGGKSVEHEVSIISAIQAMNHMDVSKYDVIPVYISKKGDFYVGEGFNQVESFRNVDELLKKATQVDVMQADGVTKLCPRKQKAFGKAKEIIFDIAFPIVHGTNVEDGALQGYLKSLGVVFVGCDVCSAAVCMDKYISKEVCKVNDIPVLDCITLLVDELKNEEVLLDKVEAAIGYPVIVKPVNLGSSVGIAVAQKREELSKALFDAFSFSRNVLVETAVMDLREINCSVLGDESFAKASVCEEPMHTGAMLSYEDKYVSNAKGSKSQGMASVSRQIPANIPEEMNKEIQELAVRAFHVLKCNGVVRIDFILDASTGRVYLNEVNTIPGSLSFYLWEASGMKYKELLTELIELALKRKREEDNVSFAFDTNILKNCSLGGSKGAKL